MGKPNTDHRMSAILFAHFMERNREKCLEIISSLQEVDLKSWILTAKICSDDQIPFESEAWFKDSKSNFKDADWEMEIDRFHLNNDGLTKSLEEFAKSVY